MALDFNELEIEDPIEETLACLASKGSAKFLHDRIHELITPGLKEYKIGYIHNYEVKLLSHAESIEQKHEMELVLEDSYHHLGTYMLISDLIKNWEPYFNNLAPQSIWCYNIDKIVFALTGSTFEKDVKLFKDILTHVYFNNTINFIVNRSGIGGLIPNLVILAGINGSTEYTCRLFYEIDNWLQELYPEKDVFSSITRCINVITNIGFNIATGEIIPYSLYDMLMEVRSRAYYEEEISDWSFDDKPGIAYYTPPRLRFSC